MSGNRLAQGLSLTSLDDPHTTAEQSARRSSHGSAGRRPSDIFGDAPIALATRPASPLHALDRGLHPQTKERSKSFVDERFNRESLDMLKPPAQVVTEAIANEPEIFTLFSLRGRTAIGTSLVPHHTVSLRFTALRPIRTPDLTPCFVLPRPQSLAVLVV